MKLMIPVSALKAALCCIGKFDPRRTHVTNILLEADKRELRLVSTNGAIFGVVRVHLDLTLDVPAEGTTVLIHSDTIKAVLGRISSTMKCHELHLCGPLDDGYYSLGIPGVTSIPFMPETNETLSRYRGIIPRQTSGEVSQLDPALLRKLYGAIRTLGYQNPFVCHNGGDPSIVLCDSPDFVGVIAAMTPHERDFEQTAWVYDCVPRIPAEYQKNPAQEHAELAQAA